MASNFSSRGFYRSTPRYSRSGRVSTGNDNNSPTEPVTTHGGHDSSPLVDRPATEVSNEMIYRSIMNLNRTVQGLVEANKRQEEALEHVEGVMGGLTEEVRHLRERLEEDVDVPAAKRQKRSNSALLSEMVRRLHNSDDNEKKYDGEAGLNSTHNETVTSFLLNELKTTSEYPESVIRSSCVSYYETIRRRHVRNRPENTEKTARHKEENRLRSRRGRLLEKRGGVIRTEEEMELWTGVSADLMSDEEAIEVDGVSMWLVKPPSFRSPALSDLCNTLQTRLDADPKFRASHKARRKEEGAVSTRQPPTQYDPEKATRHLTTTCTP